ncbi:M1 family metallopeptidase [Bacteroidia bacterium]|nr:M1 family metallopeptidase [Bacteroidia bacterium]MDB9882020.1 M1 family metallopeptidase [Bacteroidia bacterium]
MKNYIYTLILSVFILIGCGPSTNTNESTSTDLSKDAHSFANFNDIRVSHISLNLATDFDKKVLKGTAKLFIKNYSNSKKLILDTKKLSIAKVTLDDGEETQFVLGPESDIFGQAMTIDITPDTKFVTVEYETSPDAEALQWLSPEQTLGKVHPFLFSQSQAILARSWVPCQDGPGVKFTYDAIIKTDPDLIALMSAENGTEKNSDGIYSFKMDQPISSYLLALTIGDLKFASTGRNSGVYAEPEMLDKAVWELESMQSMIDSAETMYGPYAWGRYDVVILPPSFPFGGMENPRLTFATPTIIAGDRSLVALVAHELAHSWSGNLVTNETWNDFWLNEGFTVYFEQRIMEKIFGKPYQEMLTKLGMGDLERTLVELEEDGKIEDTHLYLELDGRDPDDGLTDVAYEKGRFFLQTVESVVGRKRFDAFLKEYFSENKFKPMNTERFLTQLNTKLLKDDAEIAAVNANEWIYGPGLPDNVPAVNSTELDRVERSIAKFNNDLIDAKSIDTEGYTTHHWLYLLRGLKNLNIDKMQALDDQFAFSKTGNSEIACDWFKHCIEQYYKPAYPFIKSFLIRVGRRKFLTPLYERLAKTEENKSWALEVYKKARPGYHSVSANTIDEVLNYR